MITARRTKKTSASYPGKLAADIKQLKPEPLQTPLKVYWDIGARLDQKARRRYGRQEVELVADRVGWDRSMLYFCILFHQLWPTKEELDRVTKRGLVFGHVRALLHRKLTARERERLERYVATERPSIRALQAKVRGLVRERQ